MGWWDGCNFILCRRAYAHEHFVVQSRFLILRLNQIPEIFDFTIESPLAFGLAAVGVDLGGGKAEDQHAGVLG